MAAKSNGFQHNAHVKGRTVGTTNELSFSVLGAKADKRQSSNSSAQLSFSVLDNKASGLGDGAILESSSTTGKRQRVSKVKDGPSKLPLPASTTPTPTAGAVSVQTVSSASAAGMQAHGKHSVETWLTPANEVERLKKGRMRHKAMLTVVGVMLCVGVLAGAGYWGHLMVTQQKEYVSEVARSIVATSETDDALVTLDDLLSPFLVDEVEYPLSNEDYAAIEALLQKIPETRQQLAAAQIVAAKVADGAAASNDKDAAAAELETISARQTMINVGEAIFSDALKASAGATYAQDGWNSILSADNLAREAAGLVASDQADEVALSQEKTQSALALLYTAYDFYTNASLEYAAVDFSAYQTYINKRVEALQQASASNEALIARNKEMAAVYNDAYTVAEQEAAELAVGLETDPAKAIEETSKDSRASVIETYLEARAQASEADAFLREYLGTSAK